MTLFQDGKRRKISEEDKKAAAKRKEEDAIKKKEREAKAKEDAAKQKKDLEEKRRQEQRSTLAIRRVIQKVRLASPESFSEVQKELQVGSFCVKHIVYSQQQNALGYNLSMQGIGTVALTGLGSKNF